MAPLVEHRGVLLFVPELGGEYDPKNSTHYTLMTLTGGMSRGERQRVQERVRLGMAAQVETQGRYQGGRPPYGYKAVGYAPHPNPRKAAEGFRLKRLEVDEPAASVVRRIFAEWLAGRSLREIAQRLNADGIECPSARDRGRNPHRHADGWQATTIGVIIENPRYTGYEFSGRFKKTESLVDPNDASWGHATRFTRSAEPLIRSREQAHEALISVEDYTRAQAIKKSRASGGASGMARLPRSRQAAAAYALKGLVSCSLCGRKMHAERYNARVDDAERPRFVRYRCRARDLVPGSPYAATHPANARVQQTTLLYRLGAWLADLMAPANREATLDALLGQAITQTDPADVRRQQATQRLADAETRLSRLHAAIEAGVDPVSLAPRVNTLGEEVAALRDELSMAAPAKQAVTRADLDRLLGEFSQAGPEVFGPDADPAELLAFFEAIGLRITYDGAAQVATAEAHLEGLLALESNYPHLAGSDVRPGGGSDRVRGGT